MDDRCILPIMCTQSNTVVQTKRNTRVSLYVDTQQPTVLLD